MAWKKGFNRGYKKTYRSYGNKVKSPFFRMLNTEPRVSTIHVTGGAYHKNTGDIGLTASEGNSHVNVKKGDKNYGQALKALGFMKRSKSFEKQEVKDGIGQPMVIFNEKK